MCSALHCEQAAAVKILEVAERKLVCGCRIVGMRLVDPEMAFSIFSESVHANELILLLRHRMMISPTIFLINDNTSLSDQLSRVSKRVFVESYTSALSKRQRGIR